MNVINQARGPVVLFYIGLLAIFRALADSKETRQEDFAEVVLSQLLVNTTIKLFAH